MYLLVLDLECVEDRSVWTPKEPGQFAPPYAWQPIALGFVLFQFMGGQEIRTAKVGAVETGAAPIFDPRALEREILTRFAASMGKSSGPPDLVTWNGRGFDLPVILTRSMRYGIPCPWYYRSEAPRKRYTEKGHCDLADAMADHGATKTPALDGVAKLIGLPGKFGDIDGPGVEAAFMAGRLTDITTYCICDAVQTAFAWLRWEMHKGNLPVQAYRENAGALLTACQADGRLQGLCDRIDRYALFCLEGGGG
jgi:hypothetical protein